MRCGTVAFRCVNDLTRLANAFLVYSDLCTLPRGISLVVNRENEQMAQWSDAETAKLVEIWSEDKIQEELEGCKKNKHIYEKIANRMKIEGFDRSTEQCRLKVKRLRGEYTKIRDSNRSTGESRKYWKHFDVLDDILGSKPGL